MTKCSISSSCPFTPISVVVDGRVDIGAGRAEVDRGQAVVAEPGELIGARRGRDADDSIGVDIDQFDISAALAFGDTSVDVTYQALDSTHVESLLTNNLTSR